MDQIIAIVGPTGVGKTKLSVSLAKILNGEIINADSTQVYKGLDIATAKVTEDEKENIPHHLFDIKDIEKNYTVYDYQKDCRAKIAEIKKRGKTPIIVGGTGLYIKAALYDYNFSLENISNSYDNTSTIDLYNKLKEIDNSTLIHPNNRKRIIRALNYYENNNNSISSKEKSNKLLYDVIFIGLTTDRDILYDRINKRVDEMVSNGLIDEAINLYNKNISTKAVMTPIGYKELFSYFDHNISFDEAINLIKKRSRNYAKRQYTWNNHQIPVKWFDVNFDNFSSTISDVANYISNFKE